MPDTIVPAVFISCDLNQSIARFTRTIFSDKGTTLLGEECCALTDRLRDRMPTMSALDNGTKVVGIRGAWRASPLAMLKMRL